MKKIHFLIFIASLFSRAVLGQQSDATLTTSANTIKNETTAGANTSNRIGTMFNNIILSKASLLGAYSNPSWITALAWSKISGTPTSLTTYGITDAVPASRTITINGTSFDLSANRSWTVSGGGGGDPPADATTAGIAKLYPSTSLGTNTDGAPDQNAVKSYTDAQLAGKQSIDGDLTTIAGLTPTTDNFIQSKSGAWASRTIAQVKTDLNLTGTNSGDQDLSGYALLTSFVDNEVPTGTINGSNTAFTIANTPISGSVRLFKNGLRQKLTTDYTISGTTITFVTAPSTGAIVSVDYRK